MCVRDDQHREPWRRLERQQCPGPKGWNGIVPGAENKLSPTYNIPLALVTQIYLIRFLGFSALMFKRRIYHQQIMHMPFTYHVVLDEGLKFHNFEKLIT